MAVLTIYFLVDVVYRYHVRTFPRTSIDTPSRSSVFNFSSIPLTYFSICWDLRYFAYIFLIFQCNPVLLHYRCAGTYIISRIYSVYSGVIPYYSITSVTNRSSSKFSKSIGSGRMLTDTVLGSISSKTNVGIIVIQFALFNQLIRLSELLSGPEVLKLNCERQIHPVSELYMSNPNFALLDLRKQILQCFIVERVLETCIDCNKRLGILSTTA